MAVGDKFKLIDAQTFLGKNLYNVIHYEGMSGTCNAADLAHAYETYVINEMIDVQSSDLVHAQVVVFNMTNVADYVDDVLTTANVGTIAGDNLPPYVALAFRFVRSERGHHHGALRLGGLTEQLNTDGVLDAAYVTAVGEIATILMGPIYGITGVYSPRIYRAPNTIKPGYSNAEAFYTPSAVAFVRISTQNSRKF